MSLSLLRFVSLSLTLSLPLVACVASDDDASSSEPISAQESAVATGAVEGAVVAMAPIASTSPASIAASYRAAFGAGAASCATVATDNLTYVTVTFACTGVLATTGSVHLQLTSPTTLEAMANLTVGGVEIDGELQLSVPASPSSQRTFEGSLSIVGPRRMLTADASASWIVNGSCLTYSASGNVAAEGPVGKGSSTFEVTSRTICHQ
jgi:hypothetical protein